jgi:hypothetical protein
MEHLDEYFAKIQKGIERKEKIDEQKKYASKIRK